MKIENIFQAGTRPQTKGDYKEYVMQCARDCRRLAFFMPEGKNSFLSDAQAIILLSLEDDPSIRNFDDYVLRDIYRTITRNEPKFVQVDRDTKEIGFSMEEMPWPSNGIYVLIDVTSLKRRLQKSAERADERKAEPPRDTTEATPTVDRVFSEPPVDPDLRAAYGDRSVASEGA